MNKTRFMKRIFSLLMALVLTLALMPINMLTLHAEGTDEANESEITETITNDTPVTVDETNSEDIVPEDTGNSYEVSNDTGDYSAPEEQSVSDVPYIEPVAPAVEPVAEPTVEPAAEIVTEPIAEPVTETPAEPTVENLTEPTTESDTVVKEDPVTETTDEPDVDPVAEELTDSDEGLTAEETAEVMDESSEEEMTELTEAVTFTVTFDANGHGTAPADVIAEQDATISEPDALSEDGYTFTGWYKEAAAEELWDFSEDKVTENITLYAGWYEDMPKVMRGASVKSVGTYSIEYVDYSDWFVGYPPDGDYMTGNWPSNTTAVAGEVVSLPSIIRGPHAVEKPFGEGYVIYTWEWFTVVPRGYTNTATDNILDVGSGTFVMPESDVIVMGRWVYNESIQIFPYATTGGHVTWDGVNASYAENSWATLTATPDKGYYFVGWKMGDEDGPTGSIVSTNNPWRFQVKWDMRYTRYYAVFAIRPPGKIMVINGKADKYTAVEGDIITVTANDPPAGDEFTFRVFDKWTADSPSVQFADVNASVTTFEMPGPDVTVMATYAAACEIIVETDPPGFEAYTSGGGVYRVGDTVTVTASTPEGYRFEAWNGTHGFLYDSTYSFTAWKNRFVIACYEKIPTITVQESEGGTATADRPYADAGQTINLTARPKGGYVFDRWEVISGGVELNNPSAAETTFVTNGNDVVIKPHFTKLDVVITFQQVTYKVVNGTWSDGTTENKTEYVLRGFKPSEVPTGMIAGKGFTEGAWDVDPASTSITEATTFTYTFEAAADPSEKLDIELEITVPDAVYGDEIVCIVSASRDGEYILIVDNTEVGTVTVRGGLGSFNRGRMDAGTYRAEVKWDGDSDYNPAIAKTAFTVYPFGTNFTIKADPAEVTEGDTVTIIPTLPNDATGTVKYYLGTSTDGELLGELAVGECLELSKENGNALPAGTHAITARYNGDGNYIPAVKNVLVIVNPIPAVKPVLTITAREQTYTYNGQVQGEGDTVYGDPAEIAEKVEVDGLKDGDKLTSIILDGQGLDVGTYDLIPSGATINGYPASDKYDVIYVTGTLTIIKVEYTFSAGADVSWTKGSSAGIDYTINRNYEDDKTFSLFESIEVDGKVIPASNYTATAGSLNVNLKASYLNTLSDGRHTVKVNFKDGSAEATLTIKPKPTSDKESVKPAAPAKPEDPGTSKVIYVPNTGDSSNPGLWFTLLLLSLISLAGLMAYRKEFTE